MKKIFTSFACIAALIVFLMPATSFAQTPASVTWNLTTTDTTHPSVTVGNVTGGDISGSGLTIRSYTGSPNGPLGTTHMRWWPNGGASWGLETTWVAHRWIQLTVTPNPNNAFTVDSISIYLLGGGTSNMKANLYLSTDSSFSNPTLLNSDSAIAMLNSGSASSSVRFAFKANLTANSGQTLYFRIYPWYTGAASTSKYVYTQLAVIKGTTKPSTGTAVEKTEEAVPESFELQQNYPNPFNPSTEIRFTLNKSGYTTLKVFNLIGNEVATLADGVMSAGTYKAQFNAASLPSGIYMSVLKTNGVTMSKKMILMK
ncbi:MAG: T9SS type A sorting domain-containing protein [Acidobacteriota bacterium]